MACEVLGLPDASPVEGKVYVWIVAHRDFGTDSWRINGYTSCGYRAKVAKEEAAHAQVLVFDAIRPVGMMGCPHYLQHHHHRLEAFAAYYAETGLPIALPLYKPDGV